MPRGAEALRPGFNIPRGEKLQIAAFARLQASAKNQRQPTGPARFANGMSGDRMLRLYDTHAHLVSDDVTRYPRTHPFENTTLRMPPVPGTIGNPGGMHGPAPINEKPTAEQMRGWMTEQNVVGITAVQKGMIYGTDNSYILDAADLFPDEMRAIVIVDPGAADTPQLVRDYDKRGIVGIRFFGVGVADKAAWLASPAALDVWAVANALDLVVDIEAPASGSEVLIPVIERMADRFPKLRIVLDHVFLPDCTQPHFGIDARFAGFAARHNIFVKFTSLSMDVIREKGVAPEAVLRRTVDFYGADRTMWGSDIGTSSGSYAEMVARAIDSARLLNETERRKVLHDTGRRIMLGWEPQTEDAEIPPRGPSQAILDQEGNQRCTM